jgi:NAD+ synthase (glutamine-hydrolysing)
MKIALAQLNYHIGNFASNVEKIKQHVVESKARGADLVVFAELAISGYPPRDFLSFSSFIDQCEEGIQSIATLCDDIAVIVGAPSRNPNDKGKRLFNSAYFLYEGKVQQLFHKTLLPNYDIFDEYRYFEPNHQVAPLHYKGKTIAVTICEDIWNVDQNGLYRFNPMDELAKHQPDYIINIAASPYSRNHHQERLKVLKANATQYELPIFYVNHIGAQTELIFDGGSTVLNAKGEPCGQLHSFKEDLQLYDAEDLKPIEVVEPLKEWDRVTEALVLGIKDYFGKLKFQKAVIGLSGGIDSALTLVLCVKALGPENVLAVLMPSQFSSSHSVSDAEELCNKLGCTYETIGIAKAYEVFDELLQPYFKDLPFDVTEENIQARIRATLLMAFSNKFGHILLNTSNKSEMAVGYGTLYGDMCGGLSVIGDLYKTEVYALARHINEKEALIPDHIITKPASAELRPDQKDSDSLPDYSLLDQVLYHYIEESKSPEAIVAAGFDDELVRFVLRLVNNTEYKRFQAPPVLRISAKAFGMGRRMPIVGKYLS